MPETNRRDSSFGRSYARVGRGWTPAGQQSTAAGWWQRRMASSSTGNPRLAHVLGVAGKS
jgi:hypothetical protein